MMQLNQEHSMRLLGILQPAFLTYVLDAHLHEEGGEVTPEVSLKTSWNQPE